MAQVTVGVSLYLVRQERQEIERPAQYFEIWR